MSADGWAVVDDRKRILIRTVSDTRRSAIVNWLCVEGGITTTHFASDWQIEAAWNAKRGGADVIQVIVRSAP